MNRSPVHHLHSKGRVLPLTTPAVMGILNATPNSFYNKGQDSSIDGLLHNAEIMLKAGAAILDIGGASTKPGEPLIYPAEELERIMPAIIAIRSAFPHAWLSVDTYNAKVAKEAVSAGADLINDVSGGHIDPAMLHMVATMDVPYIAMHMQGLPATMQYDPQYNDVVTEVYNYLRSICDRGCQQGIADIIIDPGFGFGKTTAHNFALLRSLSHFQQLGRPVLAGISRKSIVCRPLQVSPANALNGTTALHMAALQQGANILRVHDVKEAVEVVELYKWLKGE